MPSRRRPGARADFEEMRPNRFVIFNDALRPTLRGEGEINGDRFQLTSHRREGLFGRLRERGFTVISLDDLLAQLPLLPAVTPHAAPLPRQVIGNERLSRFAGQPPAWQPIAPEDGQFLLVAGEPLARRKGRGGPVSFYLAKAVGQRAELAACSADEALLVGYARCAAHAPTSINLADGLCPELTWPSAHGQLVGRLGERVGGERHLFADATPFMRRLLASLGISG